jgi:glycosyltransferase involved in cell wall biosynthesis
MISIIIPAHNEEKVIAEALKELVPGVHDDKLEIIVVCNGCTDNTAAVVATFGEKVRCIETSVPSKTNALNLGDQAAKGFPRIYQDADVILSLDAVRHLAQPLNGAFMAASPRMKVEYQHSSWAVRCFYDVWQGLPYVQEGMIGTGVYALSRGGRQRFDKFPDIIADDRFVRASFTNQERTAVTTCNSVVKAPADLKSLLKIKTRSRLGGYEFEAKFPHLRRNEQKRYSSAIGVAFKKANSKPSLLIYLIVNLLCRIRAKRQFLSNRLDTWERDETSRF